jgi:hypothetical protein
VTPEAADRLRRIPRIKRARGYRLYTADGRRFLDMWQAGGRAILGHRGGGVVTSLKRVLDRGVLAPLPSLQEHRLGQALRRLLPGLPEFEVAVFATEERAIRAVSESVGRPAEGAPAAYWRPFMPEGGVTMWPTIPTAGADAGAASVPGPLFPVLPDGGLFQAQCVIYPAGGAVRLVSDPVPEPALKALSAAADALVSASVPPMIALAGFTSVGPYLTPADESRAREGREYGELFDGFLAEGIVISPSPDVPSIVPGELSDGERKLIERVARRWGGPGGN